MCYHTRITESVTNLEYRFKASLHKESTRLLFDKPRYHINGFSHPNMLIIPQQKPDILAPGVWGIVPDNKEPNEIKPYYKEAVKYGGGLNAQSEKLFNHFIYRNVALTQRCIIPVTGFFEPHTSRKKKYPFYIHRKDDGIMSLAGIYTVIGPYITFAILTKKASPLFEKIHNVKKRQPVILDFENEKYWLDESLTKDQVKELMTKTYSEDLLDAYTVSKDVYNTRIDSNVETISNKVEYPELKDNLLF